MKLISTKIDDIGRIYLPKKIRPKSKSVFIAKLGDSLLISPNEKELKELVDIIRKIMRKKRAEEAIKFVREVRDKLRIEVSISPEDLEEEITEAVASE